MGIGGQIFCNDFYYNFKIKLWKKVAFLFSMLICIRGGVMNINEILSQALSSPSPASAARVLLDSLWDNNLPVDPVKFANLLGIKVYETQNLGVSGDVSCEEDGQVVIRFNAGDISQRQRFTIAHELGHYVLGDLPKDGTRRLRDPEGHYFTGTRDPKEVRANRFAAALLMPAHAVKYVVEVEGFKNLEDMANKFEVSSAAMGIRLEQLGII